MRHWVCTCPELSMIWCPTLLLREAMIKSAFTSVTTFSTVAATAVAGAFSPSRNKCVWCSMQHVQAGD